uniref:Uncharacterized protein n=1 Tax=viral metagenome TaxID=1070528 RepID=A0A6C0DVS4_9ZZZZ
MKDPIKNINNFYDNSSYYELFNSDIWLTILAFVVVFLLTFYFTIKSIIRSYKTNWEINKCNPALMPFASIINPELSNGEPFEYTLNNFTECLDALNAELATDMTKPINNIRDTLSEFFDTIFGVADTTAGYVMALFDFLIELFRMFIEKITNFVLHTQLIFITLNDFFAKIISILTVLYYTLILLVSSYRLIFIIAVMGFLMVFVIPTGVIVTTQLILLIRGIVQLAGFSFGIPWTLPLVIASIIVLVVGIVTFIIALILFIILLIFYSLFNNFVTQINLPGG